MQFRGAKLPSHDAKTSGMYTGPHYHCIVPREHEHSRLTFIFIALVLVRLVSLIVSYSEDNVCLN